jgi:hypothetical protein
MDRLVQLCRLHDAKMSAGDFCPQCANNNSHLYSDSPGMTELRSSLHIVMTAQHLEALEAEAEPHGESMLRQAFHEIGRGVSIGHTFVTYPSLRNCPVHGPSGNSNLSDSPPNCCRLGTLIDEIVCLALKREQVR